MTDPDPGVSELIRRARAGSGEALESLLRLYPRYLEFLARHGLDRTLRAKAGPSDVVQECLLHAFENFGQFRGVSEPELVAWLRRILARRLATLVRRYRGTEARDVARERAIATSLDRSSDALGRLVPSPGRSPSRAAEERERSVILAEALAELPEDHRRVVVLRNFRRLSWPEVAEQMDRSADAVRMLWTRALKGLRPLIEDRSL